MTTMVFKPVRAKSCEERSTANAVPQLKLR